jgi:cytochrome oxidase assembly protein ShyY1
MATSATRLEERRLERLESRITASAVVMPDEPIDLAQFEFRRVFVTGEFDHDRELTCLTES